MLAAESFEDEWREVSLMINFLNELMTAHYFLHREEKEACVYMV